jgi:hypothetical protein
MKTMYKGVLTVVTATVIASAAIMITGAETKLDQSVVTTSEKESKENTQTEQNNITEEGTTKAIKQTAVNATTSTDVEVAVEKNYPAPPPGPFAVKKDNANITAEIIVEKPTAPTKPTEMTVAPTAPIAPTTVTIDDTVTLQPNMGTEAPTEKLKTAEINANPNKVDAVKAEEKISVKVQLPETPKVPAITTEVKIPETLKAVELKGEAPAISSEIQVTEKPTVAELKQPDAPTAMPAPEKPKVVELKQPVAPVRMQSPQQPEVTILKAPDALKIDGSFPKHDVPQEQSNTTAEKQAIPSQPVVPLVGGQEGQQGQQSVSAPISNKNAQQQPIPMMIPPTMVMPQGMVPPTIMMPPQMMNGQRVIMVPVYPMNMGRPMYPQGYPVLPVGVNPQGNIQQVQPAVATPNFNHQQEKAPADNVGK